MFAAVPSVIAVLAYNFGVRTLGVVTGTAFLNLGPVSAVLMSAALGKVPQPHEVAGLVLVVGALLIHTMAQRRLQHVPTASAHRNSAPVLSTHAKATMCRTCEA